MTEQNEAADECQHLLVVGVRGTLKGMCLDCGTSTVHRPADCDNPSECEYCKATKYTMPEMQGGQ